MQNLPLSNSTSAVFTPVQFFFLGGGYSRPRGWESSSRRDDLREERWSPNALTQWWTLPLQRQLIIVANSFTLVRNDSPNDRLCILNRQTDNRDTLVEDTRAAKHQQCGDSLGNSRLIILYVQMGIQQLIDSILNRAVLLPIHCTFWQGTCKTVFSTYISTYSA